MEQFFQSHEDSLSRGKWCFSKWGGLAINLQIFAFSKSQRQLKITHCARILAPNCFHHNHTAPKRLSVRSRIWHPIRPTLVSAGQLVKPGFGRAISALVASVTSPFTEQRCPSADNLNSLQSASWHFYFQKTRMILSLQICSQRLLSH